MSCCKGGYQDVRTFRTLLLEFSHSFFKFYERYGDEAVNEEDY